MAGINIKIKTPDASTYRSWTFVVVTGVVLALLALLDQGGLDFGAGAADCRLEVVSDELNVRSAPTVDSDLLETLARGAVVDGTRTVRDGFRELADDRWASNEFLTPLPDTSCA